MKTYLVTGGAGFIGSNLIRLLLSGGGVRVVNLDKLTYAGNIANLADIEPIHTSDGRYAFEKVDICDSPEVERVFASTKPDVVINCAAESHVDRSILSPQVFVQTNVAGTQVLLDAALRHGVERFHQVSTDEVYGSLGETGVFTEGSPLAARSPYSASKAAADMLCHAYHVTYDAPITVSRCGNNYGPYQFPEKLIPLMINNLLEGRRLPVYGVGANVRDWIHVHDHCQAILAIARQGRVGQVYNVGCDNEWRNIDLVRLLIRTVREELGADDSRAGFATDEAIQFVDDRKGHDLRYALDVSKLSDELGWRPTVDFASGLRATVRWYLDNEAWVRGVVSGEYRTYYTKLYGDHSA